LGFRPYIVLTLLTLVCLVPFCEKAFHIDDPLFVWAAQQIVKHPSNPYGFNVLWYASPLPMSEVTKNPPLASYYSAAIGMVAGWSETPLHLAFLIPAIAVILGTYYLARRLTGNPLLAAAATLLAPGFLVSSTSVMCDTTMLALWILAVIFWLEGLDRMAPLLLGCSGLLIAACALTKYYGAALIPLLAVYSVARLGRLGRWVLYLFIPVVFLAGYQYWTYALYHRGLLSDAAEYAYTVHRNPAPALGGAVPESGNRFAKALIGLVFAGGCALPAITFIPVLWSRRAILLGGMLAGLAGLCCGLGMIVTPPPVAQKHWFGVSAQLAIFAAGGICILALAFSDWRKRKDADSLLLALWVLGTFVFASLLNWTVNARSVLPLIPATGILLARRVDKMGVFSGRAMAVKLGLPMVLAGIVSVWVTAADAKLAGSARQAAEYIRDHAGVKASQVNFQGHWGFQYYMQSFGFRPTDLNAFFGRNGDVMVIPSNNANVYPVLPQFIAASRVEDFDVDVGVSTMSTATGAGFYTHLWGVLPYSFGSVPEERYRIIQLGNVPWAPR
jgi:4-amino-4-deoxy-L-arabinose transferase-like glycosyltransferase